MYRQAFAQGQCHKGKDCDMYHDPAKKQDTPKADKNEAGPGEKGGLGVELENSDSAGIFAGIMPRFELMTSTQPGVVREGSTGTA